MNIYESKIKQDLPILIESIRKVKRGTSPYYTEEQELLEKFLDDRGIQASAELIRKINKELKKEFPKMSFLYARAKSQFEYQLGREPIPKEDEEEEMEK